MNKNLIIVLVIGAAAVAVYMLFVRPATASNSASPFAGLLPLGPTPGTQAANAGPLTALLQSLGLVAGAASVGGGGTTVASNAAFQSALNQADNTNPISATAGNAGIDLFPQAPLVAPVVPDDSLSAADSIFGNPLTTNTSYELPAPAPVEVAAGSYDVSDEDYI